MQWNGAERTRAGEVRFFVPQFYGEVEAFIPSPWKMASEANGCSGWPSLRWIPVVSGSRFTDEIEQFCDL